MRGAPVDSLPLPDERAREPWRLAEWTALAAGWALALGLLLPSTLPATLATGEGTRAAAVLALCVALAFWAVAIVVVRSDLRAFVIPDEASITIAALGLVAAAGTPWLSGDGAAAASRALGDAAATGACAFALFWTIGAVFRAAGRDALGFGDVKLAGACAVSLSPADAALALELAALGAIAALLAARRGGGGLRDTAVPFGAFLAPAAWLVLVLAPPLRDVGLLPW